MSQIWVLTQQINDSTQRCGARGSPDCAALARRVAAKAPSPCVLTEGLGKFRILGCSQSWLDLCGMEANAALGATFRCIQGPKTDVKAARELAVAATHDKSAAVELTNYHVKSGAEFVHVVSIEPFKFDGESYCLTTSRVVTPPPHLAGPAAAAAAAGEGAGEGQQRNLLGRMLMACAPSASASTDAQVAPGGTSALHAAGAMSAQEAAQRAIPPMLQAQPGPPQQPRQKRAYSPPPGLEAGGLGHLGATGIVTAAAAAVGAARGAGAPQLALPASPRDAGERSATPGAGTGLAGKNDKAKARIMRNRASAERSRQRRLQRISQLESTNAELTSRLAQAVAQTSAGPVMEQNQLLRQEVFNLSSQVVSMSQILAASLSSARVAPAAELPQVSLRELKADQQAIAAAAYAQQLAARPMPTGMGALPAAAAALQGGAPAPPLQQLSSVGLGMQQAVAAAGGAGAQVPQQMFQPQLFQMPQMLPSLQAQLQSQIFLVGAGGGAQEQAQASAPAAADDRLRR